MFYLPDLPGVAPLFPALQQSGRSDLSYLRQNGFSVGVRKERGNPGLEGTIPLGLPRLSIAEFKAGN